MRKEDITLIQSVEASINSKTFGGITRNSVKRLISIIHDQSKEIERLKDYEPQSRKDVREYIESQNTYHYDKFIEQMGLVRWEDVEHPITAKTELNGKELLVTGTVSTTAYKDQVRIMNPKP